MKKLFTALLVCTMLLCIPLVSYSSDEAKTNKTEYDVSYDASYDAPIGEVVLTVVNSNDYTYKDRTILSHDVKHLKDFKDYSALCGVPLELDLTKYRTILTKHYFKYIETYKSANYSIPYRSTYTKYPKLE